MTEHAMSGSRTARGRPSPWLSRSGVGALQRTLGVATAVLLAIDAYVHFHDAHFYDAVTTSTLSEGNLFRAQAAAAVVVAVALLVRPHPVVWAVAVLVTASAVGAVLLYRYVDVGALGPLPDMYEPTWAAAGKLASAVAEGLGTLLTVIGFVVAVRTRPRAAPQGPGGERGARHRRPRRPLTSFAGGDRPRGSSARCQTVRGKIPRAGSVPSRTAGSAVTPAGELPARSHV